MTFLAMINYYFYARTTHYYSWRVVRTVIVWFEHAPVLPKTYIIFESAKNTVNNMMHCIILYACAIMTKTWYVTSYTINIYYNSVHEMAFNDLRITKNKNILLNTVYINNIIRYARTCLLSWVSYKRKVLNI